MDTQSWPWELASRCLKTKRQKKRAQKKGYQKMLIGLYKLRDELSKQKRALPLVPLEVPYQRGWKRSFILREDVARSGKAAFYEALLGKINTVMYSTDKGFKQKKRRFRKRVYVDKAQFLKAFYRYQWYSPNCALTEEERKHFHLTEEVQDKQLVNKYVFSEPWRYVLRVDPSIITHAKVVDEVLEQQIAQLDNYVERQHLGPSMQRAMNGSCWRWRNYEEKTKYRNPLVNTPLHRILADAIEDDIYRLEGFASE